MTDLVSHLMQQAKKTVWCTPNQDSQYIFQPHRISHPRGVMRSVSLMHQSYNLPNTDKRFHVYQIGQIPANFLGLVEEIGVWRPISNVCRAKLMLIDLYLDNGFQFPRFQSWITITPDQNVLIAIQDQPTFAYSLRTNTLYARLYTNTFFQSERSNEVSYRVDAPHDEYTTSHFVYVWGMVIASSNDISTVATIIANRSVQAGHVYATVNGYVANTLSALNVNIGDVVEIVHDTSVEWVVTLPLSQLETFTSTLDSKEKYLVTFQNGVLASERQFSTASRPMLSKQIYYFDDNDIFLLSTINSTIKKGVLYHRNQPDAVRHLTHRDFSLPVSYVSAYIDNAGLFVQPSDITVQLLLRKSGYQRELMDDANRISELYRFFDPDRAPIRDLYPGLETPQAMMTGIQSTLPFWRAPHLEASAYPKLMRSYEQHITPQMVLDAYGYHTAAKTLGETWQPVRSTDLGNSAVPHLISIPLGMQQFNRTITVYSTPVSDTQRFSAIRTSLHRQFSNGGSEFALPPEAFVAGYVPIMAEVFYGEGRHPNPTYQFEGADVVTVNSEFRCYKCPITAFGPNYEWVDVTDSSDYIATRNANSISIDWQVDANFWLTVVRTTDLYVDYDIQIPVSDALLRFSVNAESKVYDNVSGNLINVTDIMRIPSAKLELWINGRHLYETLDYTVNWPEIVIHNRAAYADPDSVLGEDVITITVRAHGFCSSDLERDPLPEMGFVRNGVISGDSRFDIRDSRVKRLYYDGKLIDVEKLKAISGGIKISENRGTEYIFAPALSGKPYSFEDTVVPLGVLPVDRDAEVMRQADLAKDRAISDFYSDKYPEIPPETPDFAAEPYALFSPFYFKVLMDVKNNIILPEVYDPAPTETALRAALEEYEFILPYDPALKDNAWWQGDVVIHGHPLAPVELTAVQWAFMVRVNNLYLRGAINTNAGVTIVN